MHRVQKARAHGWRGIAILSMIVLVASSGCKDGGASSSVWIDASGGAATSGLVDQEGGAGGRIEVSVSYGLGSTVEILGEGLADTTWSIRYPDTDLGPVPVLIHEDLDLPIAGPGDVPPADTLYIRRNTSELRISDGDANLSGDDVATGIEIVGGVTVTLPLNLGDGGGLEFSHDVVNDGILTVVDVDAGQRGRISIDTLRSYVADGQVLTHGTEPGQSGGDVDLLAGGAIVSAGAILAHGSASSAGDGGDGGTVVLTAQSVAGDGWIANLGDISSAGGASIASPGGVPSGLGGAGADVEIVTDTDIINAGQIDASGGDGIDGAGIGGRVWLRALAGGDVTNAAPIASRGGDGMNGPGGEGGRISLEAHGGEIRSSEPLDASGGRSAASPTAQGGRGGRVDLETNDLVDPDDPRAGDIWLSGPVDVTGGAADNDTVARGGLGGSVSLAVINEHGSVGQSVHVLGYDAIIAAGADAERVGGDGGSVDLSAGLEEVMPSGHIEVEPDLDVSGGDSDVERLASAGGDGGDALLAAATAVRGGIDVDGGTGNVAGNPGTITEP